MSIFSDRLRWIREKKGSSQRELAERIGMSQQGYSGIETGRREPNLDTLLKIRHVLDEPLDFLLGYYLEDNRAENLWDLYIEVRTDRESAEEDLEYMNKSTPPEDAEKRVKLIMQYRDEIKKLTAREGNCFNMFIDHVQTIPGIDEERSSREYWINYYKKSAEERKEINRKFIEEYHSL